MTTRPNADPRSTPTTDDPRLTAFALGELSDADRDDLAAALAGDPALAAEVDAVRALADDLAVAFFAEPAVPAGGLTDQQRFAVRNAARRAASRWRLPIVDGRWARPALASLAVAATVIVLFNPAVGSAVLATRIWAAKVRDGHSITQLDNRDIVSEIYRRAGDRPTVWSMLTGAGSNGRFAAAPAAPSFGAAELGGSLGLADSSADSRPASEMEQPYAAAGEAMALQVQATPVPAADADAAAAPPIAPLADPSRKVVKDADLTLEVDDVAVSMGRIETIAAQSGGYVLESRSDQSADGARPGAMVKFAVPVDQFEAALGRLRAIGVVADEHASGVDVSTEFTDLQSRIANLEATQARVREFLAQAKTVEEALQVNARLTEIEGQLAELKGRSAYLAGRAAYSTITVSLVGPLQPTRTPTITPSPTATATPTVTPTPTPRSVWSPAPVAREAAGTLGDLLIVVATGLIWLVVVGLPIGLLLAAAWWFWSRVWRAIERRSAD